MTTLDSPPAAATPDREDTLSSVGLLILRLLGGGLMVVNHGLGKLSGFAERSTNAEFDPIGIGPYASAVLIVFAELFCAIAIVLGLGTRLAAIPLVFAMGVAAFIAHGEDPLGEGEKALLFMGMYIPLICTGAGRFSVDALWGARRRGA